MRITDEAYLAVEALHLLNLRLDGMSMDNIAKKVHRSKTYVMEQIHKAAHQMIDRSQERLLEDLFPLVNEVFKAALKQELEHAAAGLPVNTALADRLAKGFYVLDAPQLKTSLVAESTPVPIAPEQEPDTLTALLVKRQIGRPSNKQKVIDIGESDNSTTE